MLKNERLDSDGVIAAPIVASYDPDEAIWILVDVEFSQLYIQSGSIENPQLNHRSTDYEAMQESARRLTFKHLSSVSAKPDKLPF